MLDISSSDYLRSAETESKPRSKARRKILVLSGSHGRSGEAVNFFDARIASTVIEHAGIGAAADGDAAGEPAAHRSMRDVVFDLVHRHGITDVTVDWPKPGSRPG